MSPTPRNRIELLQGTLDMLILGTLQWGPAHGYGIALAIQAQSGNVLQVETGSLYRALHRLERRDWVRSDWRTSEKNQRAKYYRLTPRGRRQLLAKRKTWDQMVTAVSSVVKPA